MLMFFTQLNLVYLLTILDQTSISDGRKIRCHNDTDCAMVNHMKCAGKFCQCTEGYRYIVRHQVCQRGNGPVIRLFSFSVVLFEPPHGKTNNLHMRKQNHRSVTAKLISAFVFATRIVHFLFYLNRKFHASCSFLCLYRSVCVRPVRKPHSSVGFPKRRLNFKSSNRLDPLASEKQRTAQNMTEVTRFNIHG